MKAQILILLIILFGTSSKINGQSWSIGFKYGDLTFQDWDFERGTIKLRGFTEGRFLLGSEVQKKLKNRFSLGLSFDVAAANEVVYIDKIGKAGSNKYAMFSIGPKIRKDLYFFPEKFGMYLGFSSVLSWIESNSLTYANDDSFRIIRIERKDEFGNISLVPLNDVVFSGERVVERKTSFFLMPEIGLFYDLSKDIRISLIHQRGYNTGKPIISRDLDPIIYDGVPFKASDTFLGNFKSTSIGLNYSF